MKNRQNSLLGKKESLSDRGDACCPFKSVIDSLTGVPIARSLTLTAKMGISWACTSTWPVDGSTATGTSAKLGLENRSSAARR
jgi:hypothetical protein